jgi:hypothetical protein
VTAVDSDAFDKGGLLATGRIEPAGKHRPHPLAPTTPTP